MAGAATNDELKRRLLTVYRLGNAAPKGGMPPGARARLVELIPSVIGLTGEDLMAATRMLKTVPTLARITFGLNRSVPPTAITAETRHRLTRSVAQLIRLRQGCVVSCVVGLCT